MEDIDKMIGAIARLPDGELVEIETVYEDGWARVPVGHIWCPTYEVAA